MNELAKEWWKKEFKFRIRLCSLWNLFLLHYIDDTDDVMLCFLHILFFFTPTIQLSIIFNKWLLNIMLEQTIECVYIQETTDDKRNMKKASRWIEYRRVKIIHTFEMGRDTMRCNKTRARMRKFSEFSLFFIETLNFFSIFGETVELVWRELKKNLISRHLIGCLSCSMFVLTDFYNFLYSQKI